MRSSHEILATSKIGHTFANFHEYEVFLWNVCRGCIHNHDRFACPIIDAALLGYNPKEFVRHGHRIVDCESRETPEMQRAREKAEHQAYIDSTHIGDLFTDPETT